MVIARRHLIREGFVSTYHVWSRCVRKAWLLGKDFDSGRDLTHRKAWVKNQLIHLSESFCIEVAGYAVMSNHHHEILRTRPDLACELTPDQIARRWWELFPKRRDRFGNAKEPREGELDQILADPKTGDPLGRVEELRKRLASISWFMRCLNEHIARKANAEDGCTGRFWEGRFKCTELLDSASILACMVYVDLNPIHADMAQTPEGSDFTSGQDRFKSAIAKEKLTKLREAYQEERLKKQRQEEIDQIIQQLQDQTQRDAWLAPLSKTSIDVAHLGTGSILDIEAADYLSLLDWTGRQSREDKPGKIPTDLAPILVRMEIEAEAWLETVRRFDHLFHRVAGRLKAMVKAAKERGRCWFKGTYAAKTSFG